MALRRRTLRGRPDIGAAFSTGLSNYFRYNQAREEEEARRQARPVRVERPGMPGARTGVRDVGGVPQIPSAAPSRTPGGAVVPPSAAGMPERSAEVQGIIATRPPQRWTGETEEDPTIKAKRNSILTYEVRPALKQIGQIFTTPDYDWRTVDRQDSAKAMGVRGYYPGTMPILEGLAEDNVREYYGALQELERRLNEPNVDIQAAMGEFMSRVGVHRSQYEADRQAATAQIMPEQEEPAREFQDLVSGKWAWVSEVPTKPTEAQPPEKPKRPAAEAKESKKAPEAEQPPTEPEAAPAPAPDAAQLLHSQIGSRINDIGALRNEKAQSLMLAIDGIGNVDRYRSRDPKKPPKVGLFLSDLDQRVSKMLPDDPTRRNYEQLGVTLRENPEFIQRADEYLAALERINADATMSPEELALRYRQTRRSVDDLVAERDQLIAGLLALGVVEQLGGDGASFSADRYNFLITSIMGLGEGRPALTFGDIEDRLEYFDTSTKVKAQQEGIGPEQMADLGVARRIAQEIVTVNSLIEYAQNPNPSEEVLANPKAKNLKEVLHKEELKEALERYIGYLLLTRPAAEVAAAWNDPELMPLLSAYAADQEYGRSISVTPRGKRKALSLHDVAMKVNGKRATFEFGGVDLGEALRRYGDELDPSVLRVVRTPDRAERVLGLPATMPEDGTPIESVPPLKILQLAAIQGIVERDLSRPETQKAARKQLMSLLLASPDLASYLLNHRNPQVRKLADEATRGNPSLRTADGITTAVDDYALTRGEYIKRATEQVLEVAPETALAPEKEPELPKEPPGEVEIPDAVYDVLEKEPGLRGDLSVEQIAATFIDDLGAHLKAKGSKTTVPEWIKRRGSHRPSVHAMLWAMKREKTATEQRIARERKEERKAKGRYQRKLAKIEARIPAAYPPLAAAEATLGKMPPLKRGEYEQLVAERAREREAAIPSIMPEIERTTAEYLERYEPERHKGYVRMGLTTPEGQHAAYQFDEQRRQLQDLVDFIKWRNGETDVVPQGLAHIVRKLDPNKDIRIRPEIARKLLENVRTSYQSLATTQNPQMQRWLYEGLWKEKDETGIPTFFAEIEAAVKAAEQNPGRGTFGALAWKEAVADASWIEAVRYPPGLITGLRTLAEADPTGVLARLAMGEQMRAMQPGTVSQAVIVGEKILSTVLLASAGVEALGVIRGATGVQFTGVSAKLAARFGTDAARRILVAATLASRGILVPPIEKIAGLREGERWEDVLVEAGLSGAEIAAFVSFLGPTKALSYGQLALEGTKKLGAGFALGASRYVLERWAKGEPVDLTQMGQEGLITGGSLAILHLVSSYKQVGALKKWIDGKVRSDARTMLADAKARGEFIGNEAEWLRQTEAILRPQVEQAFAIARASIEPATGEQLEWQDKSGVWHKGRLTGARVVGKRVRYTATLEDGRIVEADGAFLRSPQPAALGAGPAPSPEAAAQARALATRPAPTGAAAPPAAAVAGAPPVVSPKAAVPPVAETPTVAEVTPPVVPEKPPETPVEAPKAVEAAPTPTEAEKVAPAPAEAALAPSEEPAVTSVEVPAAVPEAMPEEVAPPEKPVEAPAEEPIGVHEQRNVLQLKLNKAIRDRKGAIGRDKKRVDKEIERLKEDIADLAEQEAEEVPTETKAKPAEAAPAEAAPVKPEAWYGKMLEREASLPQKPTQQEPIPLPGKELAHGSGAQGYIKTFSGQGYSSGKGRFIQDSKEIAWFITPAGRKDQLFWWRDKLVTMNEETHNRFVINEINPADYPGQIQWRNTELARRVLRERPELKAVTPPSTAAELIAEAEKAPEVPTAVEPKETPEATAQRIADTELLTPEDYQTYKAKQPKKRVKASELKVGDRFLHESGEIYVVVEPPEGAEPGKVYLRDGKKRVLSAEATVGVVGAVNDPTLTGLSGMQIDMPSPPEWAEGFGDLTPATKDQKAQAHIVAREKAMLDEKGRPTSGYRRLADTLTGKDTMADMTEADAGRFIDALKALPEAQVEAGEKVPPTIPRTTAIVDPEVFNWQFGEASIRRLITSQTYYSEVLGLKPIVGPLEQAKRAHDIEFAEMSHLIDKRAAELDRFSGTTIKEKAAAKLKNRPTKANAEFRELANKYEDAEDIPEGTYNERQLEVFRWYRGLTRATLRRTNEVRTMLGREPIPSVKAYVRHVADSLARDMLEKRYPLPEQLKYWSSEIAASKVFNPMEKHRKLTEELEDLFTKDWAHATKSMLWTALKEIHLSQPLHFFKEMMGLFEKTMPAATQKWANDYVNQAILGQLTRPDRDINAIVRNLGIEKVINWALRPFGRVVSQTPITTLNRAFGRLTMAAVIGTRPKQIARNWFQLTQLLGMLPGRYILQSQLGPDDLTKRILDESLFIKGYTGLEDLPHGALSKLEHFWHGLYRWRAVRNAIDAVTAGSFAIQDLIQNPRYEHLTGWRSPNRTGKEDRGFFYPDEIETIAQEAETIARVTQNDYVPIGMPEVFRHKVGVPITRLQSWWMNHVGMFWPEMVHRAVHGKTRSGRDIPWNWRLGALRYLVLGGLILNTLGYSASFLWGAAPTGGPPAFQFAQGLYLALVGKKKRTRAQGRRSMLYALKTFIPGYLAYKDIQAYWSGRKPWHSLFTYSGVTDKFKPYYQAVERYADDSSHKLEIRMAGPIKYAWKGQGKKWESALDRIANATKGDEGPEEAEERYRRALKRYWAVSEGVRDTLDDGLLRNDKEKVKQATVMAYMIHGNRATLIGRLYQDEDSQLWLRWERDAKRAGARTPQELKRWIADKRQHPLRELITSTWRELRAEGEIDQLPDADDFKELAAMMPGADTPTIARKVRELNERRAGDEVKAELRDCMRYAIERALEHPGKTSMGALMDFQKVRPGNYDVQKMYAEQIGTVRQGYYEEFEDLLGKGKWKDGRLTHPDEDRLKKVASAIMRANVGRPDPSLVTRRIVSAYAIEDTDSTEDRRRKAAERAMWERWFVPFFRQNIRKNPLPPRLWSKR